MSLLLSLAAVGAILAAVTLSGAILTPALLPAGSAWQAERWGWSVALGLALVSVETAAALALGLSPGWGVFLAGALLSATALRARRTDIGKDAAPEALRPPVVRWLLLLLLFSGVALYLLRALTEPMWANDYLAIWGLKGKIIFFTRSLPTRLGPSGLYGFSHPEYPLGIPLLYAGVASLLGRWDDHALALLFPLFQVATLAVLFGWLKRRGVRWPVPLAAAALLAQFEPLYSGFLTGMAEVPLSFAFLLFGTALSDSFDAREASSGSELAHGGSRALRRLAVASLMAAGSKNEGLFLAAAGALGALSTRGRAGVRIAGCALLPAAAVSLISRWVSGNAPLRDFDLAFLGPRLAELPPRLAAALLAEVREISGPVGLGILCLALLLAAGRRTPSADRLLWLAGACLAVYLFLPALAILGPGWLVRTTLARTAAALAPLVAAGVAGRLGTLKVES